jgi:hypothetical protein
MKNPNSNIKPMKSQRVDVGDSNTFELALEPLHFGLQHTIPCKECHDLQPYIKRSTFLKRIERLNYRLLKHGLIQKMMLMVGLWMFSTGAVVILYKLQCEGICRYPWHLVLPAATFVLLILSMIYYHYKTTRSCFEEIKKILNEFSSRDKFVTWTLVGSKIEIRYPKEIPIELQVQECLKDENSLSINTFKESEESLDKIASPGSYVSHTSICFS